MKKILILVSILSLLGAGVSAIFYFGVVPMTVVTKFFEKPPPPPIQLAYVDLEAIGVPVLKNGKVSGQILLELRLEIEAKDKVNIDHHMPRLYDAIVRDLVDYVPKNLAGRQINDLEVLKLHVRDVIDGVVGKGRVKAVLLQNVHLR